MIIHDTTTCQRIITILVLYDRVWFVPESLQPSVYFPELRGVQITSRICRHHFI